MSSRTACYDAVSKASSVPSAASVSRSLSMSRSSAISRSAYNSRSTSMSRSSYPSRSTSVTCSRSSSLIDHPIPNKRPHCLRTSSLKDRTRNGNRYDPRLEIQEQRLSQTLMAEYGDEILPYMRQTVDDTLPDISMIDTQPEIEWTLRPYLLDFLIDTHVALRLQPETLFLAINLIDRYCSKRVVYRKHYQLVGCTAMWIAAKYEDKKRRVPTLKELSHMCCNTYEPDMFVQMERHVLNTLSWSVGHSTVESFLNIYVDQGLDEEGCPFIPNSDLSDDQDESPAPFSSAGTGFHQSKSPTVHHVASYLCEMALYHRELVGFSANTLALAAYILSLHILGVIYTLPPNLGQTEVQCMSLLFSKLSCSTKSLQRKYSSTTLSQAHLIVSNFVARQQYGNLTLPPTPPPYTPPTFGTGRCVENVNGMAQSRAPSWGSQSPDSSNMDSEDYFAEQTANQQQPCFITPPCSPSGMKNNAMKVAIASATSIDTEAIFMEYSVQ